MLLPLVGSCVLAHLLHRLLHVRWADIPNVSGDGPAMAKRIFELAIAIAQEHVGHGHGDFCARGDSAGRECIDVIDIQVNDYGRALEGLGPSDPHSGISSTSITVESPMRMLA